MSLQPRDGALPPEFLTLFAEFQAEAPMAPRLVQQMAALVVASPKACSDAILLHADAFRILAERNPEMDPVFRLSLTQLSRAVERHAPARADGCSA